ncbi:MAG: cysteine--tRNA ligase [Mycoplasma sp.]
MRLYNSLSQSYIDLNDDQINIYNCGPTVYNHIHIGNARPLIVFDVLYRTLLADGKNVNYLHNITDIDDKIINAAIKNKTTEKAISEMYTDAYADIRHKLNTKDMNIQKVTDNIDGIIDYISRMVDKQDAYEVNGNVYFNTKSISCYGELSNRILDDQIVGERVSADDQKLNDTDFVLWKNTKDGIKWDTKWCQGRPGWHSECSYLIEKFFGNNLTIHGGGIDLKFPHHENENAQHHALHGCGLAKVWMHVGHININNQKMSKSLNNFILVKDLIDVYGYETIRWFMYKTNYRNPLEFSDLIMQDCKTEINKIEKTINLTKTHLIMNDSYNLSTLKSQSFLDILNNDLDISNGITYIQKLVKDINISIRAKEFLNANSNLNELIWCLSILGIEFNNIHDKTVEADIIAYKQNLDNKNYEQSDIIRDRLVLSGVL